MFVTYPHIQLQMSRSNGSLVIANKRKAKDSFHSAAMLLLLLLLLYILQNVTYLKKLEYFFEDFYSVIIPAPHIMKC
jgi:uncharacterized integral membrane protein